MDCEIQRYIVNKDIIPLYIDSAKTFMSLSSGGLGITMIFREKIIGERPCAKVSIFMIICWILYLLTIGASAFYQYLAVKFLDSVSCAPGTIEYFKSLVESPGHVYGAMLILFFLASLFLVIAAWQQICDGRSLGR